MEQTIKYAIFVVIMAVIIIAILYFGFAGNVVAQGKISRSDYQLETSCLQWRSRNCTDERLAEIDNLKTEAGEQTLTELCTELYPYQLEDGTIDEQKTIEQCRDICKNKCNPKLTRDVGVHASDIRFIEADKITTTIHNYGSATMYDIQVIFYNNDEGAEVKIEEITIPVLYSQEEYDHKIDGDVDMLIVEINITDQTEENNRVKRDMSQWFV